MEWIAGAAFLDDIVFAIYHVVPRTSVPVVIAGEHNHSRTFYIQRDVEVV
jgi:hypothetical protein